MSAILPPAGAIFDWKQSGRKEFCPILRGLVWWVSTQPGKAKDLSAKWAG